MFANILDHDNGWADIVLDRSLEVSFIRLGRTGIVRFRLAGPAPFLRLGAGRNSDRHGILGLNSRLAILDIGKLDCALLFLGFHVDGLLGSLCGARLARTKRSFGALAVLLLFLYGRRLMGFVGTESLVGIQQGLMDETVIVKPLLAFFVRAANQSLIRILGTVASAARLCGLKRYYVSR